MSAVFYRLVDKRTCHICLTVCCSVFHAPVQFFFVLFRRGASESVGEPLFFSQHITTHFVLKARYE